MLYTMFTRQHPVVYKFNPNRHPSELISHDKIANRSDKDANAERQQGCMSRGFWVVSDMIEEHPADRTFMP